MKISVSQIKQHRACPMLAHYEYDLLRLPIGQVAVPLGVGTVVHASFEALLIGKNWEYAAEEALHALDVGMPRDEKLEEIHSQWDAIAHCIKHAWRTPEDWEVLMVEKEMTIPCGRHEIVGRLDAVVRWNGTLWHLQHKTVASNKVLPVYAEQQRTDWHEAVYQRMLEREFPDETISGTLLNCIRKMSMKAATEKPYKAFESFFLPRSEGEVNDAFADLEQEIDDIEAERAGSRRIVKNRSHCGGKFDNYLCAYKEVCDEGNVSIDDDERFVTVDPRYTQDVQP